jgi:hypothetical protein
MSVRDVTAGATGVTAVTPKFSNVLTLFQPGGADSAQHQRGRTNNFPVFTSVRDVTAGATSATAVAPKFSNAYFNQGGQILPNIAHCVKFLDTTCLHKKLRDFHKLGSED